MASYINLTLDTTAPGGVSVLINGDETKTASTVVTLAISCSDSDTADYQMKIWGVSGAETEDAASWETFAQTKSVTLPTGDGIKTVYVKVRDDVWNESVTASDTISLYTSVPEIIGLTASRSKVSLVSGKDSTYLTFGVSEDIDALKIMLVDNVNASYNDVTNIAIPTDNGSCINDETGDQAISGSYMEYDGIKYDCVFGWYATISAADINAVSPGDGAKIVKVFVRSATSGNWSV